MHADNLARPLGRPGSRCQPLLPDDHHAACDGFDDYLAGRRRIELPGQRRLPLEWFTVRGARMHNLQDLDVSFPVAAFSCVTGVSGSGKSTLVNEILYKGMAARLNRGTKLRAGDHDGIDVLPLEELSEVLVALRLLAGLVGDCLDRVRQTAGQRELLH